METLWIPYPRFSTKEMADLFSYLYTVRYVDEPGDATNGMLLFSQKGCIRCHAAAGEGGKLGPDLAELDPVLTPLFWAQAMWNHAPIMETHMREMNIAWPRFKGEEMNNLLAYIRKLQGGPLRRFDLLPADPGRGATLFRKHCIACHAIDGVGGTVAPDLGSVGQLASTLTQVAGQMWNHSPEMWAEMTAKDIERPAFEGQEMADLIAFLYSVRYFELAGSPAVGQELFVERECSRCHGLEGEGAEFGPGVRRHRHILTQVTLANALWSHGPAMYKRSQELGLDWPSLQESDVGHLLVFLNSTAQERR
jgi:mono/diheme cytochrome c family protein